MPSRPLGLATWFLGLGDAGPEGSIKRVPYLIPEDLFEDRSLLFDRDAISEDQLPVLLVDPAPTLLKAMLPEGFAELRELKAHVGVPGERADGPPREELLIPVGDVGL